MRALDAIPAGPKIAIVAAHYRIEHRQQGTSHVTFRHKSGAVLSVPAARSIKAVYVRRFVALLDSAKESR